MLKMEHGTCSTVSRHGNLAIPLRGQDALPAAGSRRSNVSATDLHVDALIVHCSDCLFRDELTEAQVE